MSVTVPHRDSPAPWKIYRAENGTLLGIGDRDARGVTDYQGGFWGSGANKRANINLIAAAPELYRELSELVEWLEDHQRDFECDVDKLVESARAALAKSRGESTNHSPQGTERGLKSGSASLSPNQDGEA